MSKQNLTNLSTDELFSELAKIIQEKPELKEQFENMLHSKIKATLETMTNSILRSMSTATANQLSKR